jgi:SpoIIAA-like
MISLIEGLPDEVVAAEAKGKVTADDYESVLVPAVERARERFGKVRLLYVIGEDFESFSAGAMWDDTKLGLEHPRSWEKLALVTDVDWIRRTFHMVGWMIPGELKIFANAELEDAKRWVTQ